MLNNDCKSYNALTRRQAMGIMACGGSLILLPAFPDITSSILEKSTTNISEHNSEHYVLLQYSKNITIRISAEKGRIAYEINGPIIEAGNINFKLCNLNLWKAILNSHANPTSKQTTRLVSAKELKERKGKEAHAFACAPEDWKQAKNANDEFLALSGSFIRPYTLGARHNDFCDDSITIDSCFTGTWQQDRMARLNFIAKDTSGDIICDFSATLTDNRGMNKRIKEKYKKNGFRLKYLIRESNHTVIPLVNKQHLKMIRYIKFELKEEYSATK
jgi:hypothetical protein